MKRSIAWFWAEWQMPPREVWKLSASDVDEFLERAIERKRD